MFGYSGESMAKIRQAYICVKCGYKWYPDQAEKHPATPPPECPNCGAKNSWKVVVEIG